MEKIYKEINLAETETTINVLYKEKMLSIYTTKPSLQRELCKVIGEPTKEFKNKRSIIASRWDISLSEKGKIRLMMLKANIFEL